MEQRVDFYRVAPEGVKALAGLDAKVSALGLEPRLLELVRLRASQINGCAYCVDLHTRDAGRHGETDRRLHAVAVWREAPFFTPRERAALGWTESLTRIADTRAPDVDFAALQAQFSEAEMVNLTLAIGLINTWNRIAVGFRKQPAAEPGAAS